MAARLGVGGGKAGVGGKSNVVGSESGEWSVAYGERQGVCAMGCV